MGQYQSEVELERLDLIPYMLAAAVYHFLPWEVRMLIQDAIILVMLGVVLFVRVKRGKNDEACH